VGASPGHVNAGGGDARSAGLCGRRGAVRRV